MALPTLGPHNFAAAGNMEAALRPFMSLNLRHLRFLTPLLGLLIRYR